MDEALAVGGRKRVPAEHASATWRLRARTGACWVDSEAFSIQELVRTIGPPPRALPHMVAYLSASAVYEVAAGRRGTAGGGRAVALNFAGHPRGERFP
jgi:hypothetical protein